jgi:hypothetical protein
MDWGMRDGTACIWVSIMDNKIIVTDEYCRSNLDPASHVRSIELMQQGRPPTDHNVIDKTSAKRESNSKSVAQQFMEAGIRPLVFSQGNVEFGTTIMKRLIKNDQVQVSTRCQGVINAMVRWEYDAHEPDELAALRYAVVYAINKKMLTIQDGKKNFMGVAPNAVKLEIATNRVIRVREQTDLGWDYEDGCPDE